MRLLSEGYPVHTYILGEGQERPKLEMFVQKNNLRESVTLLGYQTNPYKYLSRCDLFLCASIAEGFSTAATEALIVGTAVCTVDVSGMKEMLGENNEHGIVTENSEDALYRHVKQLVNDPALLQDYKHRAAQRGQFFAAENTVEAAQKLLNTL